MTTANILLTQTDIIFGKQSLKSLRTSAGNKRLWEILKETFEAHRNAGPDERRDIEKAIAEQVKKDFPSDDRFLQTVAAKGSFEAPLYSVMTDQEVRKGIAATFRNMRSDKKKKEKILCLPSHEPASQDANEDMIFVKTIGNSPPSLTIRLAQEIDPSDGQHNNKSTEQPIREILDTQQRLKDPAVISKNQEPLTDVNQHSSCYFMLSETAMEDASSSTKRPIETITNTGSRKKARVSLPDPPDSSELARVITEEPVEWKEKEDLKKRISEAATTTRMEESSHKQARETLLPDPPDSSELGRILIKQEPSNDLHEELATVRNHNRHLLATIERLQNENTELKQQNAALQDQLGG